MDYTKELSEQLVGLGFDLAPANLISEVELPSDLSDVYLKVIPNGKVIVTPFDETKIGSPAKIYVVNESGVDTKFSTLENIASDISNLTGYSTPNTTETVALESEDDGENKENEKSGKHIVDRYAIIDIAPIMNRVSLYSKLHPENDYTEIMTLLQNAKNLPQVEEIQKEHELMFPKILIMDSQIPDEVAMKINDIYNPPSTEPTPISPAEEPKPEGPSAKEIELQEKVDELQKLLDASNSEKEELYSLIDKLGEKLSSVEAQVDRIMTKTGMIENPPMANPPASKPEPESFPTHGGGVNYGATLKALSQVPMGGEVLNG